MIPKGWSSQKLSSVASIIDCKHRTPEYVKSGIPLVSPGTIKWGALDLISPVKRVTEEEYRSLMDHCVVEQGDLVMSRNQSVGVVSYVDSKKPFVLGQDTVLIKAIHADWRFIYYTLQSDLVQRQIAKSAGGSTFSRINLSDIRALNIKTPAICEQDKISQILTAWDKAISVTESLLANSQQQKKALMQQLLTGNKRLLDENGVRFSGEWKITKLIQMGKVVSGGTPDTNMAMYWEGDILWLTPTDVTALTGRFVSNTSRKITPAGLLNSSAVLLPKGSLMVCTRATIGALAISTSEICTNQGFKNIIPNEGFNIEFIYYLLQMNTNEMIKKSSGSTFLELSKKDFETLSFSCPFIKEQQKIAAVLSAADTEISTLEKKLACLKDEKKALMQQLLTGKRRVKVDEAVAV
ncbi:restriction endonuclease subunit S [Klebsiella pneumoniae]|jgi:type I restriction enzyme S subunit|uniref:Restriction endonuclease subunit S n=12 Tax=Enterobacterales TaxID=91347 RepID=G7RVD4_KLEPN|nr:MULTISPECIES: restriction endonuclease subunit S [Enterobacterales]STS63120.1 subunit S of type I restriction-modification system [Klebsiella aerogenes]HBR1984233.1 restriction endonuclease subunit S [Klebsiella quasipneumoniae subsp. quasipneumoniae]AET17239.1 Type I restriction modification system, specificity protein [Klebsiella pneumoniae]AHG55674.1 Type I restriction modification system, specificity protein [Klebsiella pneumoniae]AHG55879.1 type I restriction modification system, speci